MATPIRSRPLPMDRFLWQAAGPAKYLDARGAREGQFDYVEPSPSAPRNSPEAVDRDVHGPAHDRVDGEVERLGGHRVQSAAHTR